MSEATQTQRRGPRVNLSGLELQILWMINCGADHEAIAVELEVSRYTVRDKLKRLRGKLGLLPTESMYDMVELARARGAFIPECTDEDRYVDEDDDAL